MEHPHAQVIDASLILNIRHLTHELQVLIVKAYIDENAKDQNDGGSSGPYFQRRNAAPDFRLTSISPMVSAEAHHYFYQTQLLSFTTRKPWNGDWQDVHHHYSRLKAWQELRDPRATKILVFTDRPDWVDVGSRTFRKHYKNNKSFIHAHKCRKLITRLALEVEASRNLCLKMDLDWPLKVDWTTLPNLVSLTLRLFSPRAWSHVTLMEYQPEDEARFVESVKKMYCLKLQHLVLMDICSGTWDVERGKEAMTKLFEPCLGVGGKITFDDSHPYWYFV